MEKTVIKTRPSIKATMIGQISLLAWALSACFIMTINSLPQFQILSGIFFSGFIGSSVMNTIRGNWVNLFSRPRYLVITGIIGIIGNDVCYIVAFKHAPAVIVDLIVYLWPILVIILASILLNESIRYNHIIACITAFFGIFYLLSSESDVDLFGMDYIFGYLCAFCSAIVWSVYVVISKQYGRSIPELFAVFCGVGFIITFLLHLNYEQTVVPTFLEGTVMIFMGITTHSFAYYGWDYAIKNGHFKLLSILPYASPIISVVALGFCGFAELTEDVLISAFIVFISAIIGWFKPAPKSENITIKKVEPVFVL